MGILSVVLATIYFYIPAYIANMMPVIAGKLKLPFGKPINIKLFGSHKTWRGFYSAYLGALITVILQFSLYQHGIFKEVVVLNFPAPLIPLYAFLFGIGAITGDLIKSFFKRRIGIKAGRPFFPFDQIDLILGASFFLMFFTKIPAKIFITALLVTPLLHLLTNVIAYKLKLKKVWW